MEQVYERVEWAISRRLHLGAPAKQMSMHGRHWHYPVGIENGLIVMRDSDCGLAKPTWTITCEEWVEREGKHGLWRQVGLWDFVLEDDAAGDAIAFCHRYPDAAGRELARLRCLSSKS